MLVKVVKRAAAPNHSTVGRIEGTSRDQYGWPAPQVKIPGSADGRSDGTNLLDSVPCKNESIGLSLKSCVCKLATAMISILKVSSVQSGSCFLLQRTVQVLVSAAKDFTRFGTLPHNN